MHDRILVAIGHDRHFMSPFFLFCVTSATEVCFGEEAAPMYGGGTVNIS